MKHIKSYKIFESGIDNNVRRKEISTDQADRLLDSLEHYSPWSIEVFRAYESESESFIYDPSKGDKRKRSGTAAFYIGEYTKKGLIDSEVWESFDNRQRSVICTTNYDYASDWKDSMLSHKSSIYSVVPLIDEVFVCPGNDFNRPDSWKYLSKSIDIENTTPGKLNSLTDSIVYGLSELGLIKVDRESWANTSGTIRESNKKSIDLIKDNFDLISKIKYDYPNRRLIYGDNKYKVYGDDFKLINTFNRYKSLEECISDILDPIKNGFKKMKYSELNKNNSINKEVWFNCECLMVKYTD